MRTTLVGAVLAFLFSIGSAIALTPTQVSAATAQLFITQSCQQDGSLTVRFDWQGNDTGALQQWLDLSLLNNGWEGGTFLGAGPLLADSEALTWPGIKQDAVHFVRLNQLLPAGFWDPSPTFYFTTVECPALANSSGSRMRILAPIDSASIMPEAPTGRYVVSGKAGLPNGCAEPDGFDISGSATNIVVSIYDSLPVGGVSCTEIYGSYDYHIDLGENLLQGSQYRVAVNDRVLYFTPALTTSTLAAPSAIKITGALPDLNVPVPPGEGELGRITVSWQDNSDNEAGFHIYNDCGGMLTLLANIDTSNQTSYGPLESCRPGRVGVAAYNGAGESPIVWSP